MFNIAIVEDNPVHANRLEEYIRRFEKEEKRDFEITTYSCGEDFFHSFHMQWDIIFLDVEMPGANGITVAEKIRLQDPRVILIFVTNLMHYAIKGYSVNAADYIVKPIIYTPFSVTMHRVVSRLDTTSEKYLVLNTKDGVHKVPVSSLYYVEVEKHYLTYHTAGGDYSIRGTMTETADMLGRSFSRCSNCYLVNLKYVTSITRDTVYVGPHQLQVSRRAYSTFLADLNDYLSGGIL